MTAASSADGAAPFPVERSRTTPHGLRLDIQALRGLAILLVLLHHAHVPFVPGGFLGVDIFFVISGYLMTGIIARELDEGRFTFASFYARRARRLLPAAYCTAAVTAIAAPFLLDSFIYRDFLAQLAGALTFTVNLVLWQQSDYFSTGAALKPLLHMWSLSIEEQYYVVLPLLLVFCPARWRLALAILLTVATAALCFWAVRISPTATFYLLPTRAWELGLGSVTALVVRRYTLEWRWARWPRFVAALVLVAVPLLVDETGHPGLPAFAVCLATALLLVPGTDLQPRATWRPMLLLGDRSYSLYLVHWPPVAFVNNMYVSAPPGWAYALLALLCLGLAEIQYRLVEQPFRNLRVDRRAVALFVALPLVMIGGAYAAQRSVAPDVLASAAPNRGFSAACNAGDEGYAERPECRTGPAPDLLLWGDSMAMHLAQALDRPGSPGLVQATKTGCGPLLDLAPYDGAIYSEAWARSCLAFNDGVLAALRRQPGIRTVVLSSILVQYVPEAEAGWQVMERTPQGLVRRPLSNDLAEAALLRTAAAIRAAGKRVVLVTPPPASGADQARCHRRLREDLPTLGARPQCLIQTADYRAFRRPVIDFTARLRGSGEMPVIDLAEFLCDGATCRTTLGGTILYFDPVHFSMPGAAAFGQAADFRARAEQAAR